MTAAMRHSHDTGSVSGREGSRSRTATAAAHLDDGHREVVDRLRRRVRPAQEGDAQGEHPGERHPGPTEVDQGDGQAAAR